MALPKLDTPLYNVTLPVSQKKISFRAFKVKEEKVLLTGKEGSAADQMQAMKQIDIQHQALLICLDQSRQASQRN